MYRSLPLLSLIVLACNQPPEAGVVQITPAAPSTTDDLVVDLATEAVDPNGKDVTYTYAWSVDGVAVEDLTSDTVPAARTGKGQVWSVSVVASDGKKTSPAFSAEATIVNSGPTAGTVTLAPATVRTNDTVTATVTDGADADGDELTASWSWTVNGTEVATDGTSLAGSFFEKGDTVALTVVWSDGEVETDPVSADVIVSNTAPTAPGIAIDGLNANADLLCEVTVPGTDVDGDELAYQIRWQVDGADYTGPTYTTTWIDDTIPGGTLDGGQSVVCLAATTDGTNVSGEVSSEAVTLSSRVTFHSGYYWVKADYPAEAADHNAVCAEFGLVASAYEVTLTWDETVLTDLSEAFGYTSAGVGNCCAQAMWCWDGEHAYYPDVVSEGQCETHNFGASYQNYGRWAASDFVRPVFTCVEPAE